MTQQMQNDRLLKSRLKIRHLRLITALDEYKNLHRAAESMCIPQPAASKLLAEIESIFGQTLFIRHARGLTPNLQGEVMVRNAHVALRTLLLANEEMSALSQGHAGIVTVGTVVAPMVELLAEAIERVKAQHPKLKISIDLDVSDVLAHKLLDGKLDFSLARLPYGQDPAPFLYHELWGEGIHFLCSDTHPLTKKRNLVLSDLSAWPWVLQPPGSPLRTALEREFSAAGVVLNENVVNSTSALAALIMVDRSTYITALEWRVARLLSGLGRFRVLTTNRKISLEPFGLLQLAGRTLSPGAAMLYDTILELAQATGLPHRTLEAGSISN
ncbi:MAG TPA: LysR family transcriptional regulator [Acidocella sp.]|jgi:DNA-binding transcriptional LysR family regulator|uniref:LysR family transcriptional regulator n=1 Tax=Acidocella sp. TaxID=50710 RepID=UPI002B918CEC|nr:LysR family transcriptional regulator [Acidocella sp.]HVE22527.1 LysR family transcriptional regulator [Acidocella sp.]